MVIVVPYEGVEDHKIRGKYLYSYREYCKYMYDRLWFNIARYNHSPDKIRLAAGSYERSRKLLEHLWRDEYFP